jgi:redox-regulated HSP33 family molecular chaperone
MTMQRNKVTDAEAIEYILFKAAKPEGVSNAQVANYCECSDSRAYKLIKAAGLQFKLNAGRHWHEQGRCEVRYFFFTEHADAFAFAGISAIRKPNVPA